MTRMRFDADQEKEWVELRGLEPLTASMPSTVGLCSGPALRLAIGHPRPPLTATMRADW
jgi:hypothetical protein